MKQGVNIVITNNQGKALVLKRSLEEKSYPCLWDLPGGKVKEGETLRKAAEREAEEESGLNVRLKQKYFYIYHCQNRELDIYGFRANFVGGEVNLSDEHTEFRWISKNEREDLEYTPSVKATLEEFFK